LKDSMEPVSSGTVRFYEERCYPGLLSHSRTVLHCRIVLPGYALREKLVRQAPDIVHWIMPVTRSGI
jgi:hypothetical protein